MATKTKDHVTTTVVKCGNNGRIMLHQQRGYHVGKQREYYYRDRKAEGSCITEQSQQRYQDIDT